jgi:hypothetical protein
LWELVVLAQLQIRGVPQVQSAASEALILHMKSTHPVVAVAVQAQDLQPLLVTVVLVVVVVAVVHTLFPELAVLQ